PAPVLLAPPPPVQPAPSTPLLTAPLPAGPSTATQNPPVTAVPAPAAAALSPPAADSAGSVAHASSSCNREQAPSADVAPQRAPPQPTRVNDCQPTATPTEHNAAVAEPKRETDSAATTSATRASACSEVRARAPANVAISCTTANMTTADPSGVPSAIAT